VGTGALRLMGFGCTCHGRKNPNMAVDKKTLKRMEDIDKLDDGLKDKLFFLLDNVVQNYKAKKTFAL